jgi:hypothetical protein
MRFSARPGRIGAAAGVSAKTVREKSRQLSAKSKAMTL